MVNDSKTEFLIVGSKQQLERVNIPLIHVGEDQITHVTSVRNLGVIFDSNWKMDMQITKAYQNAYYHLHNIRRIRKFLSQEATCTIIHAFITRQIDYCNSLMNGLPENLIKKLQRVQNTAARLVFNLRKYDRITPALVTLHWLPVKYPIEFITLLIVFKGLHDKAPIYIQEMITPSKSKGYSIRSNEERVVKAPKFKHDTFGKHAFAVYGPLAWNCLPKEIRLYDEIEAFKRNLKTHLFVKFVNESTLAIWFWRIIVKHPRMLSAQFVALYKPCKPKPKPIISFPLRSFINHSLCTGIDPRKIKLTKVIPQFKKDDEKSFGNYNPIPLQPSFSKMLDRITFNQLYDHLVERGLLYQSQYGFHKFHSIELAALEVKGRTRQQMD